MRAAGAEAALANRNRSGLGANHDVDRSGDGGRFAAVGASQWSDPETALDAAVATARAVSQSGDAIVLSPGAPSFDQFRDYTERGRRFIELAGFDPAATGTVERLGIE